MGKLTGKVAVVTGASKGIGAGIARAYAAEGAAVVVNYASSRAQADEVVSDIVGRGGRAIAVQADVARADEMQRLFGAAREAYGEVDVLVNNAGVYAFDPIESVTEKEFRREFDVNVLGTLLATQEALKHFRGGRGSVINLSSVVSVNPPANLSVYGATKGAIDAITLSLARELGPRGIRVNAIAPGGTMTEGFQAAGIAGSDFEKQLVEQTPLGRVGTPDDVARVAVFLASDDAGWITGERISVSGGFF